MMHYVKVKGILSASNGINLYRGCQHGCIYCDARSRCYHIDHVFEDIEVKENALELLENALRAKRNPCMIGTGAMSDPYIPLEQQLQLTRKALQLIEKYGFGIAIQTKSPSILRDLDVLKQIHDRTKAVVQITLTTWNDELCRVLEPNVAVTSQRIAALKKFQESGIPTVVWLCPILPFINDMPDNVGAIVDACYDAGVKGVINFGMGLTLRDGNREYFYRQLDLYFPGVKERYIRTYGNAYDLPSPNSAQLQKLFHDRCEAYGIWHDNRTIFQYMSTLDERSEQMSLF